MADQNGWPFFLSKSGYNIFKKLPRVYLREMKAQTKLKLQWINCV
jgi:hypothetical protein